MKLCPTPTLMPLGYRTERTRPRLPLFAHSLRSRLRRLRNLSTTRAAFNKGFFRPRTEGTSSQGMQNRWTGTWKQRRRPLQPPASSSPMPTLGNSRARRGVQRSNSRSQDLKSDLGRKDQEIAREQGLLEHDRDIRELMGSRMLYITEVYERGEERRDPAGLRACLLHAR
jgi:hypothetical protein